MTDQVIHPTTTKRLKRIAPLQLGLMLGVTYALLAIVIIPIILLFGAIASAVSSTHGGQALPGILGMGVFFIVFLPVLYGVMGFIGGVIGALIYNLVAKWIGGIEVEVA
jgi:hypothetical protein